MVQRPKWVFMFIAQICILMRQFTDRAQSESLGTLLLVAVVVISVGTFGIYYVASVTGDTGGENSVSLDIDATPEELRLTHNGGESVSGSSFEVTVKNASGESTYVFDDGTVRGGDGDGRLDAGEVWRLPLTQSAGSEVVVTVVNAGENPERLLLRDMINTKSTPTVRPDNV